MGIGDRDRLSLFFSDRGLEKIRKKPHRGLEIYPQTAIAVNLNTLLFVIDFCFIPLYNPCALVESL
jgi:hypothetical protein